MNLEMTMNKKPIKEACKKCRYFTKNPKHGCFKCYTPNNCPAYKI